MNDELFNKRTEAWRSEGDLTSFNLACVAEAMDTVDALSDQNTGWEAVEKRLGEHRPVTFVANEETVWDVVATTNEKLHEQVLSALATCKG